jgi:hypothetical protein
VPLATSGTGREVRKTVTVVVSDLVGSTPLGERLDPESLREVITRYYDRAAEVLARHGGTVAKFIGDAVNGELEAAWGVRLALRTGVNTGEVVVGDAVHGQEIVVGDAVNVAARLEQAAGPGEVKGKGDPVGAFRLLGVRPDSLGHARHLDAPMVGRTVELGLLGTALRTAVAERACHLALVLGPAGVGKDHERDGMLHHQERALEVDPHDQLEVLLGKIRQRPHHAIDPSAGEEGVQAAVGLAHLRHQAGDTAGIGHVEPDGPAWSQPRARPHASTGPRSARDGRSQRPSRAGERGSSSPTLPRWADHLPSL